MNGREERMNALEKKNLEMLKSFPTLLQDFYYSMAKLSPNSKLQYMTQIKVFFHDLYGEQFTNEDITGVTGDDINKYLTLRQNQIMNGKIVGESIIAMQVTALKKLYEYLRNKNLITVNPIEQSSGRPKVPEKDSVVYLEYEEIRTVLNNIENGVGTLNSQHRREKWISRNKAIFLVLIFTGLRKTALIDLNIEDLYLEKGYIKVIEKRKKYRTIEVNQVVVDALNDWLHDRKKMLGDDYDKINAVFISRSKGGFKRISSFVVRDLVDTYAQFPGKNLSPHKLRATFATMYYRESGGDLLATQKVMGHEKPQTTQRYAVPDMSKHKSIMENITRKIIWEEEG